MTARVSPALAAYEPGTFEPGEVHGVSIARSAQGALPASGFVADLSAAPKRLVVGAGAAAWLDACGYDVPDALLEWRPLGGDGAVACVHRQRFLLIQPAASTTDSTPGLPNAGRAADDVLVLDHEDGDLALTGALGETLLAEFCALDPGAFARSAWIPARVAQCDVALRRLEQPALHYRLLCAPAEAAWLVTTFANAGATLAGFDDYLIYLTPGDPT